MKLACNLTSSKQNRPKVVPTLTHQNQKTITMLQALAADIPRKEIDMADETHVVPNETKLSVEAFDNHPTVTAIAAWDQIGSQSVFGSGNFLARQASLDCL
jgi:hypothetical protein